MNGLLTIRERWHLLVLLFLLRLNVIFHNKTIVGKYI
jgi:hypothetical protein